MHKHPLGHTGISFRATESALAHFSQIQDASRSYALAGQTKAVGAESLPDTGWQPTPSLGKRASWQRGQEALGGRQKQIPCNQPQPDLSLARCHSHSHHYHSAEHPVMPEDAVPHPRTRVPNRPNLRGKLTLMAHCGQSFQRF